MLVLVKCRERLKNNTQFNHSMRHTVLQRTFYDNVLSVSSYIPKDTQNLHCERSIGYDVMVNCCFYRQKSPQIYYTEEILFIVKESITCNCPCRVKD
jgi:hypothetical protein